MPDRARSGACRLPAPAGPRPPAAATAQRHRECLPWPGHLVDQHDRWGPRGGERFAGQEHLLGDYPPRDQAGEDAGAARAGQNAELISATQPEKPGSATRRGAARASSGAAQAGTSAPRRTVSGSPDGLVDIESCGRERPERPRPGRAPTRSGRHRHRTAAAPAITSASTTALRPRQPDRPPAR